MAEGQFQLDALLVPIIDERAAQAKADEMARVFNEELAKKLKPVEIKVTAQQSANVNRSLEAMTRNLQSVGNEAVKTEGRFRQLGITAVAAFRQASLAKDAFRANLTKLNADLAATATQAAVTGLALAEGLGGAGLGSQLASSVSKAAPQITSTVNNVFETAGKSAAGRFFVPVTFGEAAKKAATTAGLEFKKALEKATPTNLEAAVLGGLSKGPVNATGLFQAIQNLEKLKDTLRGSLGGFEQTNFSGIPFTLQNIKDGFAKLKSPIQDAGGSVSSFFDKFKVIPQIRLNQNGLQVGLRAIGQQGAKDIGDVATSLNALNKGFVEGQIGVSEFESLIGDLKLPKDFDLEKFLNISKAQQQFKEGSIGTELEREQKLANGSAISFGQLQTKLKGFGVSAEEAAGNADNLAASAAGIGESAASAGPAVLLLVGALIALATVKFGASAVAEFDKLDTAMSRNARLAREDLSKSWQNLKLNIGQALSPAVTNLFELLTKNIKDMTPALVQLAKDFGDLLQKSLPVINFLIKGIRLLVDMVDLAVFDLVRLGQLARAVIEATIGAVEKIPGVTTALHLVGDAINLVLTGLDSVNGLAGGPNALSDFANVADASINHLNQDLAKTIGQSASAFTATQNTSSDILGLITGALDAQKSANDAAQRSKDIQSQINDLTTQRDNLTKDTNAQLIEQSNALDNIKNIEAQLRDLGEERSQAILDESRRQQDYQEKLDGFDRSAQQNTLDLAQAKRDVVDAQKALNDAQKAGLPAQQIAVDLTGLNIDDIKTRLALARSNLATQKQVAQSQTTTGKTVAELQDDLASAQLKVQDVEQNGADIAKDKARFIEDQNIALREYQEHLTDLDRTEGETNRARTEAQTAYNQLLTGETGIKSKIKDLNAQIADLAKQKTAADEASTLATKEAKIAADALRGDKAAELADQISLVNSKKDQAPLDAATTGAYNDQLGKLRDIEGVYASIQSKSAVIKQDTGNILGSPDTHNITQGLIPFGAPAAAGKPNSVSDFLNGAATAFGKFEDGVVKGFDWLSRHDVTFPGFHFAQGAVVDKATPGIFGEAGLEAILPLTKPVRLQQLLADQRVLSPVLSALGRINLPGADLQTSRSPILPAVGTGRPRNQDALDRLAREKDHVDLAKAIVRELVAAGGTGSTTEAGAVTINVAHPNPDVAARAVKSEIEKYFG